MLLGTFARVIFGNDAGIRENKIGRRSIRVSSLKSTNNYRYDARVKFLHKNGYLKLGNPYEPELITEIKSIYLDKIKHEENLGKADQHSIKPALLHIPAIKKLLNEDFQNLVRSYYGGGNFEVIEVAAWRNYYLGERGLKKDFQSNLPHNDFSRVDKLRIFVFLSDEVTISNGATKIFSIKATKKIMRSGYFARNLIMWPARRILKNQEISEYMEGDTGFSFAFNPQLVLHQAGLVSEGRSRDAICITVISSELPIAKDWEHKIINEDVAYMKKITM